VLTNECQVEGSGYVEPTIFQPHQANVTAAAASHEDSLRTIECRSKLGKHAGADARSVFDGSPKSFLLCQQPASQAVGGKNQASVDYSLAIALVQHQFAFRPFCRHKGCLGTRQESRSRLQRLSDKRCIKGLSGQSHAAGERNGRPAAPTREAHAPERNSPAVLGQATESDLL
jgi:hypothetical protein